MDAVEFLKQWKRICKKYQSKTEDDLKQFLENCEKCLLHEFCVENENLDCERCVETVEQWAKAHPVISLTDQQKTAIRGRIAEGINWVVREKINYDCVWFFENEPKMTQAGEFYADYGLCSDSSSIIYNFVTFENSPLYLPDLLGGE